MRFFNYLCLSFKERLLFCRRCVSLLIFPCACSLSQLAHRLDRFQLPALLLHTVYVPFLPFTLVLASHPVHVAFLLCGGERSCPSVLLPALFSTRICVTFFGQWVGHFCPSVPLIPGGGFKFYVILVSALRAKDALTSIREQRGGGPDEGAGCGKEGGGTAINGMRLHICFFIVLTSWKCALFRKSFICADTLLICLDRALICSRANECPNYSRT